MTYGDCAYGTPGGTYGDLCGGEVVTVTHGGRKVFIEVDWNEEEDEMFVVIR